MEERCTDEKAAQCSPENWALWHPRPLHQFPRTSWFPCLACCKKTNIHYPIDSGNAQLPLVQTREKDLVFMILLIAC